jgi:sialate O-acetylesterase
MKRKFISTLVLVQILAFQAFAGLELPKLFSDHMVLQQGEPVAVWGWATAGEEVTVTFADQEKKAKANAEGRWSLKLDTLKASAEGRELTVAATETVVLKDVLVGEVWICSGQSNMQWSVNRSADSEAEIAAADHPGIRLFTVQRMLAPDGPKDKLASGAWQLCNPTTIPGFSAVAYYFGRDLHQNLQVPVGLIHSSWGGTPAESWASRSTLDEEADFKPLLDKWDVAESKTKSKHYPGTLYNGMIHPLIPYSMKGAIWYQGESNARRAFQYKALFPKMIQDWRTRWGKDFPFYFVQLANFKQPVANPGTNNNWVELQWSQFLTLQLKNTGMAVINDIGAAKNAHPTNKQDVGKRLARWALNKDYGKSDVLVCGPLFKAATVEGESIRVSFDYVGDGLDAVGELKHFEICGADNQWQWASARIDKKTVVVSHADIAAPVAVRYAWSPNPTTANLRNKEGLPASCFRSDAFTWMTEENVVSKNSK